MILEVSNDFNIIQYTFMEYNSKLLSTEKWDFWDLIEKNVLIVERGQAKYNYSLKI